MATETFNRKELKYVVSDLQKHALMELLTQHMILDEHNIDTKPYRISNLYIDTWDNQLIRHSLSQPKYKEKIRVRSYYDFDPSKPVFLEVKKRLGRHTNKRRTKISYPAALDFIATGNKPAPTHFSNQQVIDEMHHVFNQKQYLPKTVISYNRLAYNSGNNNSFRVTIDSDLTTQRFGETAIDCLLEAKYHVLEVKSVLNIPLWLTEILTKNHIYRQSFSKYGKEYQSFIIANQQKERHMHV